MYFHSTLMAYASEQICMPYCTNKSHCTSSLTASSISHTTANYVPATNIPLKCHIYDIYSNYMMWIIGGSMAINMTHLNSLVSSMSQGVLYADDNNADNSAAADMHNTTSMHTVSWPILTTSAKQTKKQSGTFTYCAIAIYMPTKNIPSKCHIYAIYVNEYMCRYQTICQYICFIWNHCNKQGDQEHLNTYSLHYWHLLLIASGMLHQHCLTHWLNHIELVRPTCLTSDKPLSTLLYNCQLPNVGYKPSWWWQSS